jgi:hypothetical protein
MMPDLRDSEMVLDVCLEFLIFVEDDAGLCAQIILRAKPCASEMKDTLKDPKLLWRRDVIIRRNQGIEDCLEVLCVLASLPNVLVDQDANHVLDIGLFFVSRECDVQET